MELESSWKVWLNPAWRPFSSQDSGGVITLGVVALLLILLTLKTYTGHAQITRRRVFILLVLRLLALLLAVLTALRPSIAWFDRPKIPSTLIIVIDQSESMSVKDEYNDYSRWEVVKRALDKSKEVLETMKNDQEVTIYLYRFAKDFNPKTDLYQEGDKPEGKRTDFGTMLHQIYETHQGESHLRGVLIVSDGIDNGEAYNAQVEVSKFRGIRCPIYAFGVGQSSTRSDQKDIAFTGIVPNPSPAPIKSEFAVKGILSAQGFEGASVDIQLLLDDKPTGPPQKFILTKPLGNEIEIKTKAPDQPGEVKVTLKIVNKPPGDSTEENNSIETYLTVTREGIRILVIDRLREELSYIRQALASDKRFDYVELIRQTDSPLSPEELKILDFQKESYDVIILGDISAKTLTSIDTGLMEQMANAVREKGTGLIMLGGLDTFGGTEGFAGGGDWFNTPIAEVLPVKNYARGPQIQEPIRIKRTVEGGYMTKLEQDLQKNNQLWDRLNQVESQLDGFTLIGEPKTGAVTFLKAIRKGEPETSAKPLLVGQSVGKGRTVAFGADTVGRKWRRLGLTNAKNPLEGVEILSRFWKQMVIWAAHQDEIEGNVYVRPEWRRLAVNGKQTILMGVRNKRNEDIPDANIDYQILAPDEQIDRAKAQKANRDGSGQYKTMFEPKRPGEYRVVVWGEGKDPEGEIIKGEANARFIVYPDLSDEMIHLAANHKFLLDLENIANGTQLDVIRKGDQVTSFLTRMKDNPLRPDFIHPKLIPNWNRNESRWFLSLVLVLFVGILGGEWLLRRLWGLV